MIYVVHFCRNKACNNGWLDEDLTNAGTPPTWKYCSSCVDDGFKQAKSPLDGSSRKKSIEAMNLARKLKATESIYTDIRKAS